MPFSTGVKRKSKGLVVGVDMENTAFNKILEMSDSKVSSQQFTIKRTVFQFRRAQLLRKEGDRFLLSMNELF